MHPARLVLLELLGLLERRAQLELLEPQVQLERQVRQVLQVQLVQRVRQERQVRQVRVLRLQVHQE